MTEYDKLSLPTCHSSAPRGYLLNANSSSKLCHMEDDIFKGLGYVFWMQGAVFILPPATQAVVCVLKMVEALFCMIMARFHTKGNRLAIMTSRYHSITLACAAIFVWIQTNIGDDYICCNRSVFLLFLPSLYCAWINRLKTPPGTLLKQKVPFQS